MGYSTWFNGEWTITPQLKPEHLAYLRAFAESRRMRRDEAKAEKLPDPLRLAAGLPIGFEGAYFVGSASDGNMGQNDDKSVLNHNEPPGTPDIQSLFPKHADYDMNTQKGKDDWSAAYREYSQLRDEAVTRAQSMGIAQPGLWCQWRPNEDGTVIEHDGGEKFYDYCEWIEYLVHHFLGPWGYKLNGDVYWDGEESDDKGLIEIRNNTIKVRHAVITYR